MLNELIELLLDHVDAFYLVNGDELDHVIILKNTRVTLTQIMTYLLLSPFFLLFGSDLFN